MRNYTARPPASSSPQASPPIQTSARVSCMRRPLQAPSPEQRFDLNALMIALQTHAGVVIDRHHILHTGIYVKKQHHFVMEL